MSVADELKLAAQLTERLTQIEAVSQNTLLTGLPFEKYQQSCGYLECLRQVRDTLIPELVTELQKR